ncbi:MAG: twin transmembrane helix small protein [Pseudomonadota bacterium]
MAAFIYFLIPFALAAVAIVLGLGIYSLARGGAFAKRNSNKLMQWRVGLQALAIAIMMAFLWAASRGA